MTLSKQKLHKIDNQSIQKYKQIGCCLIKRIEIRQNITVFLLIDSYSEKVISQIIKTNYSGDIVERLIKDSLKRNNYYPSKIIFSIEELNTFSKVVITRNKVDYYYTDKRIDVKSCIDLLNKILELKDYSIYKIRKEVDTLCMNYNLSFNEHGVSRRLFHHEFISDYQDAYVQD